MRSAAETRSQRFLLLLLLVTLAAKALYLALLWPAHPGVLWSPDSGTYVRPALALLKTGTFSQSPAPGSPPEINRTPGYPALIAGVYALAGERPVALAAANIVLSTASIVLVAILAGSLFGPEAALSAALLLSLEPGSFRYSTIILTEAPFVLVMLVFLAAAARFAESRRPAWAMAMGSALGASVLVRPILHYFVPIAAVVLFVGLRRAGATRKRAGAVSIAFLLPASFFVGGWMLRNARVAGRPIVSTVEELNLYLYRAASVEAEASGESLEKTQERFGWREFLYRFGYVEREGDVFGDRRYVDLHPETARLPTSELARDWGRKGREVLRAHPILALKQAVTGLVWLLFSPCALNWAYALGAIPASSPVVGAAISWEEKRVFTLLFRDHPAVFALSVLSFLTLVVLYSLAALGLARSRSGGRGLAHALLAATALYLVAVSSAPGSVDDRFRLPLMPIVCLYAGAGLVARRGVHHPLRNSP
ncbi:MAG TPA: glycosyltransferase family 39 protein [Thermoanaerobaculia bacterium]|nr:glycosyltransferase family 39 protein [Thermoanaerobaculia bacterium]